MIKIGKFSTSQQNGWTKLSQPVTVNETTENIFVEVFNENAKYLVDDRADAIIIGLLPMAQRHNHDIYSELPVSGELLHNLNHILIPTLAKYDSSLSKITIHAEAINKPLQNHGAIGTGLSLGIDAQATINQYHNHPLEDMRLTHLLSFDNVNMGINFGDIQGDFQKNRMFTNQHNMAKELGLPVVDVKNNLVVGISTLVGKNLNLDMWQNYICYYFAASLGKLFKKYYFSSGGVEYSKFMLIPKFNVFSSEHYALFLHEILNSHKTLKFIHGAGELTRYEKIAAVAQNPISQKYLHSCFYISDFNCGFCKKCRRNLLMMDAAGCLDNFSNTYDIAHYNANREDYLKYLVAQHKEETSEYFYYFEDVYEILQAREPQLFAKLEENLSATKSLLIMETNQNFANRINLLYKAASNPLFTANLRDFFASNKYKNVILYGNNQLTQLLAALQDELQITVTHIVEDTKIAYKIPRLPFGTVDYPPTDTVIICALTNKEYINKKLQQRLTVPIHFVEDIFAYKNSAIKPTSESMQIKQLTANLQEKDGTIQNLSANLQQKNAETQDLSANLQQKNGKIKNLNRKLTQKDLEIQQLKNRISELETSTSWKITQPLRDIKMLIKST